MRNSILSAVTRAVVLAAMCAFTSVGFAQAAATAGARPLTILVIGGSGMVGSRITAEAASRGHHVIAAARRPERISTAANVTAAKLDANDQSALIALAKERNVDVIVSAVSPRNGGDKMQEAKAIGDSVIAAGKATGKRIFVVGGGGSLKKPDGTYVVDPASTDPRTAEPRAMRAVLESLKVSGTNWTFFSPPPSISPGVRTGNYQIGTDTVLANAKGESKISAEDYAKAVVDELETPRHLKGQMTIAAN